MCIPVFNAIPQLLVYSVMEAYTRGEKLFKMGDPNSFTHLFLIGTTRWVMKNLPLSLRPGVFDPSSWAFRPRREEKIEKAHKER